jgi:hypothetical protein
MRSVSEKIDERILRLLGLEDVFDIDYDTYLTLLKEAIVAGSKKLPQEELALLANERKRIRGKKGRFSPKKEKITASKVATTKLLKGTKKTLSIAPSSTTSLVESGGFDGIKKTLDSILKTLGSKFKFDQKQADEDRKEKETEKRGKRESTLEGFKKGVAGIVSTTKKMLSPFQAIIDRIWRFVFFTLLGRAFTKFMDWMSDKENQNKFNSFIEFLTDHWPALAGLYILFGTGFGKLVRGLLKGVTRMIVALAMSIPKIFGFIRKNKKLSFLAFAAAPLVSREIGNLFTDKPSPEAGLIPSSNPELDQAKQSTDQAANTKVPTLNLGGMIPSFKMGGVTPFGGMGGMDFYGGVPISGAGQDNTLIAAKTGEAILTERDQQDIGQRYIDRTTGQPLNIPQYLAGRKPGSVAMSNLRFPGFGGGFSSGGMISKFKDGGIVGGSLKRQSTDLTKSASSLMKENWSYASRGGDAKNGCAPAINEVYKRAGISVPWGSVMRPNYVPDIQSFLSKKFLMVSEKQRKPGDIVIWKDTGDPPGSGKEPYGHIGIVMPDGRIANNSTSKGTFSNLNTPEQARSWWPNTQSLIYYRHPQVNQSPTKPNSKPNSKPNLKPGVVGGLFTNLLGGLSINKKQGGGLVNSNTGMDISGTADTQLTGLQRGEYVLPVDTVSRLGGPSLIDRLVAMTDSNSTPFKQGALNRPQITPYSSSGSGSGGMITLPPITQSTGGSRARSAGLGGGSEVPEFSATAPNNDRAMNASIYGLVG